MVWVSITNVGRKPRRGLCFPHRSGETQSVLDADHDTPLSLYTGRPWGCTGVALCTGTLRLTDHPPIHSSHGWCWLICVKIQCSTNPSSATGNNFLHHWEQSFNVDYKCTACMTESKTKYNLSYVHTLLTDKDDPHQVSKCNGESQPADLWALPGLLTFCGLRKCFIPNRWRQTFKPSPCRSL